MATVRETVENAKHPFSPTSDELNPPDVILRSSDLVDFYSHKAILSFGSPFFKHMFAFPEPMGEAANPTKDGLPLVILPEPREALEKLLVLCYPRFVSSYLFRDLDGVDAAYEAVKKYDISGGRELLEAVLVDPRFLQKDPYRVFAIACHRGLENVAELAAMATLTQPPFDPSIAVSIPELKVITAYHLCQLQLFHRRCSQVLVPTLRSFANVGAPDPYSPSEMSDDDESTPVWWEDANEGHDASCGMHILVHDDGNAWSDFAMWFRLHMESLEETCDIHHESGWIAQKVAELSPPALVAISKCPRCVERAPSCLRGMAKKVEVEANQKFQAVRVFSCM
ncbi:hypothetical protein GGX14DRAFT_374727 [Mycena pura]|uniref:BTB domain-containing protein n=1 Tax=Mycena pura TaxID=153505 RepID=A0AAD6Y5I9_9AGAR|nr:hypothetical protein GGX14DRAFT_374727 [Mycena pura]